MQFKLKFITILTSIPLFDKHFLGGITMVDEILKIFPDFDHSTYNHLSIPRCTNFYYEFNISIDKARESGLFADSCLETITCVQSNDEIPSFNKFTYIGYNGKDGKYVWLLNNDEIFNDWKQAGFPKTWTI